MNCARAQELFSSYLEDTMETPLRVAFEQHLNECGNCKAVYERFNATAMMLDEMPDVEAPANLRSMVMARVEEARRATPPKVKWWRIDWERVFTVRVPARAAAVGLAAVLLMALMMQLTPVGTMTANMLWGKNSAVVPGGIHDADQPKTWSPLGVDTLKGTQVQPADSGLTIRVMNSDAKGGYALQLAASSDAPVSYRAYTLGKTEILVGSGVVSREVASDVAVPGNGSGLAVVRLDWRYEERAYAVYAFLPDDFDIMAADKNLTASSSDETVFERLKVISEKFGVVIVASGDLNVASGLVEVAESGPGGILEQSIEGTGLSMKAIAPSIYMIQSE